MSRSSGRRGQAEPLAALAAVFAVGLAVSLYAGALPTREERPDDVAESTLSSVYADLSQGGVVDPARAETGPLRGPPGYAVNLSLSAGPVRLARGPPRSAAATNASRPVAVRTSPGRVRAGRLSVGVWT